MGMHPIKVRLPEMPRSGDDVLRLDRVSKTWTPDRDTSKTVFSNVSAMITRQSKTAVVGVNGAGKSTLLKIIAQQTEPTSGEIRLGAGVSLGYFSQHAMDILDAEKNGVRDRSGGPPPGKHRGDPESLRILSLLRG